MPISHLAFCHLYNLDSYLTCLSLFYLMPLSRKKNLNVAHALIDSDDVLIIIIIIIIIKYKTHQSRCSSIDKREKYRGMAKTEN